MARQAGGRWSSEACLAGGAAIVQFVADRLARAGRLESSRQARFDARFKDIVAQEAALRRHQQQQQQQQKQQGESRDPLLSDTCLAQIDALSTWPVYTLVFRPAHAAGQPGSLELAERGPHGYLDSHRFDDALFGFQHPLLLHRPASSSSSSSPIPPQRVGFIPALWIRYLVKTRVLLALQTIPSSS
jgi:hypothetical protein